VKKAALIFNTLEFLKGSANQCRRKQIGMRFKIGSNLSGYKKNLLYLQIEN